MRPSLLLRSVAFCATLVIVNINLWIIFIDAHCICKVIFWVSFSVKFQNRFYNRIVVNRIWNWIWKLNPKPKLKPNFATKFQWRIFNCNLEVISSPLNYLSNILLIVKSRKIDNFKSFSAKYHDSYWFWYAGWWKLQNMEGGSACNKLNETVTVDAEFLLM